MGKCLVTKLNGSVQNSSLLRLGEMRIRLDKVENPTEHTQGFGLNVTKPIQLEVIGDGYFTDKTLTQNLGKTKSISNYEGIWVSNGAEIAVLDKYSLSQIVNSYPNEASGQVYSKNILINISELKYSTALTNLSLYNTQASGDIASLKNLNALTYLNFGGTQVSGDIANLKGLTALTNLSLNGTQASGDITYLKNLTALKYLSLYASQITGDIANLKNMTALTTLNLIGIKVNGDIANLKNMTSLTLLGLSNTNVTGDIANLKNMTSLTNLSLYNTQASGDIASLKNMTKLTTLSLSNTNVSGDIANLKNMTKLNKELMLNGLNLSGNIGDLPNEVLFVTNNDGNGSFTWTTSSRTNILAMENIACDNIDKLLQDMSNMNANFAGQQGYHKTISLIGTRTSASDAAVQTLQSKGYTVSITPA